MDSPDRAHAARANPSTTPEKLLRDLQRLADTNAAFRKRNIGTWSVSLSHDEPLYTSRDLALQNDEQPPEAINDEYGFSVSRHDAPDHSIYGYEYGLKSSLYNTMLPDNLMQHIYGVSHEELAYTPLVTVTHSVGVSINTSHRQLEVSQSVEYFDEDDELLVSAHTDLDLTDEYNVTVLVDYDANDELAGDEEGGRTPLQFRANAARLLEITPEPSDIATDMWLHGALSLDSANLDIAHMTLRSMKRAMRTHLSMNV